MNPIFLDCESAGLRGDIFSAALIGPNGEILFDGFFRHEALKTNTWLAENVEPNLTGTEFSSIDRFRAEFANAWRKARFEYGIGDYNTLAVVAHMGSPVESNFFQQLFDAGELGEFEGPYPLLDTAPLLLAAGYDPTSEQGYANRVGITLPEGYKPHSALSDAELTRRVWKKLMMI